MRKQFKEWRERTKCQRSEVAQINQINCLVGFSFPQSFPNHKFLIWQSVKFRHVQFRFLQISSNLAFFSRRWIWASNMSSKSAPVAAPAHSPQHIRTHSYNYYEWHTHMTYTWLKVIQCGPRCMSYHFVTYVIWGVTGTKSLSWLQHRPDMFQSHPNATSQRHPHDIQTIYKRHPNDIQTTSKRHPNDIQKTFDWHPKELSNETQIRSPLHLLFCCKYRHICNTLQVEHLGRKLLSTFPI